MIIALVALRPHNAALLEQVREDRRAGDVACAVELDLDEPERERVSGLQKPICECVSCALQDTDARRSVFDIMMLSYVLAEAG